MHARFVEFLQKIIFVLKHKSGAHNRVADALNRRNIMFITLQTSLACLEDIKNQYANDKDFGNIL